MLIFGINDIFQIKYFIKNVKQNVQFLHAMAYSPPTLQKYSKGENSTFC